LNSVQCNVIDVIVFSWPNPKNAWIQRRVPNVNVSIPFEALNHDDGVRFIEESERMGLGSKELLVLSYKI
jgi:hypothetical protein